MHYNKDSPSGADDATVTLILKLCLNLKPINKIVIGFRLKSRLLKTQNTDACMSLIKCITNSTIFKHANRVSHLVLKPQLKLLLFKYFSGGRIFPLRTNVRKCGTQSERVDTLWLSSGFLPALTIHTSKGWASALKPNQLSHIPCHHFMKSIFNACAYLPLEPKSHSAVSFTN